MQNAKCENAIFEMAWQLCTYFKNVPFNCCHKIKAKLQKIFGSKFFLGQMANTFRIEVAFVIIVDAVSLCYPVRASFMVNWRTHTDTHMDTHTDI